MEAQKILLSTDIGSDPDDALALLVMLNHPAINLQGIYTVNGDVDSRSFIAKHMVNVARSDIPVGKGAGEPLGAIVRPYSRGEGYLVDYSFVDEERMNEEASPDIKYVPIEKAGIITQGIAHFAQQLEQGRLVVFSIAPLTNLAWLKRDYPDAFHNIQHLYIMGSKFPQQELSEHNFRYDALAAQEVLASEIPITLVPGNLCERYKMPVQPLSTVKSGVGKYVRKMVDAFIGSETALELQRPCSSAESLYTILEKIVIPDTTLLTAPKKYELEQRKGTLMANLDVEAAYCDPDLFWREYKQLIDHIKNPAHHHKLGSIIAEALENIIPHEVSIADVYVPYCYLHPERLKTERLTVSCNEEGKTIILPGKKHNVVLDLDWDHFKEFVERYAQ